jgi:5-amino-6-(5-phosphoribosylamino)uracil reductase
VTNWAEALRQLSERKTKEAVEARPHPFVTEVEHRHASLLALGNDWTMRLFDGRFFLSPPESRRPSCNLVFVQSRDGNTGATNPSTLGGGETDKHLVYEGLSRIAADAVLAGAETVRIGDLILSVWHPELVELRRSLGKPRHPIQMVATKAGLDAEHALMFNVPEVPVVVLTSPAGAHVMRAAVAKRPWVRSIVMDTDSGLAGAFQALRSLGIDHISCIGGRRLAEQLLDAGLVQDVYLTTAAQRGGEPGTPLYSKPLDGTLIVRKRGTETDAGVIFEHLRL